MTSKIALFFIAACVLVLACNGATMHKRETEKGTLVSDANKAIDKIFSDLKTGINQLAADGVNVESIFGNITSKASEFGEQIQKFGTELGQKVSEAAKNQGISS